MRTQGENIHGWMDEYQEAKKEIGDKKKEHTQGENIQGMNGWMKTKK